MNFNKHLFNKRDKLYCYNNKIPINTIQMCVILKIVAMYLFFFIVEMLFSYPKEFKKVNVSIFTYISIFFPFSKTFVSIAPYST